LCPTELRETIIAHGHENVAATHRTTFEITKETHLSRDGDCIIAVGANKALDDLSPEFKENLRKDGAKITVLIEVNGVTEIVTAVGNSRLALMHPTDIIVRKSGYVCNRTLAIHADKAANELSRELVNRSRNPNQKVKITLIARI
jgi:hypothetical protein